jgi:hypothetical protein
VIRQIHNSAFVAAMFSLCLLGHHLESLPFAIALTQFTNFISIEYDMTVVVQENYGMSHILSLMPDDHPPSLSIDFKNLSFG